MGAVFFKYDQCGISGGVTASYGSAYGLELDLMKIRSGRLLL
jgi:hypothetical protein